MTTAPTKRRPKKAVRRPPKKGLERACAIAGSQIELGRMIGKSQSFIWYWLERAKDGVPAKYCSAIERATGVPRHELRPDLWPPPRDSERAA